MTAANGKTGKKSKGPLFDAMAALAEEMRNTPKGANRILIDAAINKTLYGMKRALEKGADINARSSTGETALHIAISHLGKRTNSEGHGMVKFLLDRGADINAADKDGNTPLHWAVQCNESIIIGEMLERGADTSAVNSGGYTPLSLSRTAGYNVSVDTIEKFISQRHSQTIRRALQSRPRR